MTGLTVVSVAYPFAAVGPDAVGGAEQVLSALDRALVAAGHASIVLACEGSAVAGHLVALPAPAGVLDEAARAGVQDAVRRALAEALLRHRVDVVHLHGVDFHAYLPPPGPPALATMHLPPDWYPRAALAPARPDTWLHGVSVHQHARLRELVPPDRLLPPIGNGVAVAAFGAACRARRSYALMLGRICPEKGQHLAIEAARIAGVSLLIAGAVFPYPAHRQYWEKEVAPRLDRRRRCVGPLGFARKCRLLAGARCLLVPSLAEETSSLVAMEALASGTPVIAFPAGALADIVEPGRTGFLVGDAAEMAAAIGRTDRIDPTSCRQAARQRFDLARTIAAYLDRYRALAATALAAAAC
ncbi:MAG: glycosyltransferase [Acidisphaera sp.]|nr:glycosyltransferase [Acidisphaera sp.]